MSFQQHSAIVVTETYELTIEEISLTSQLPVEVIMELVGLGLFETSCIHELRFDAEKLSRIQSAARLFHDLKINAPGVVLALELLDEIDELRDEMSILKKLMTK